MMVHGNVELLSSFVDGELEAPARRAVESHLADCRPCRERLGSLRRLVAELRSLEAAPPPAGLEGRVRRAILFEQGRAGGLRRSAESLRRWIDQPLLLPLFGVVTALAVLLYLLTAWTGPGALEGTRLVVAPAAVELAEGAERQIAGRDFVRREGRWVERGVDPAAVVRRVDLRGEPGPEAAEALRPLGGRVVAREAGEAVELIFGD